MPNTKQDLTDERDASLAASITAEAEAAHSRAACEVYSAVLADEAAAIADLAKASADLAKAIDVYARARVEVARSRAAVAAYD